MKTALLLAIAILVLTAAVSQQQTETKYKMQLPPEATLRNFVGSNQNQGFSLELSVAPKERSLISANGWLQNLDLNEIRQRLETLTFTSEVSQYTLKTNEDRVIFSQFFTSTNKVETVVETTQVLPRFFMSVSGVVNIDPLELPCPAMQIISSNYTDLTGQYVHQKCQYVMPAASDKLVPVRIGSEFWLVFKAPKFKTQNVQIFAGSSLILPLDELLPTVLGDLRLRISSASFQCVSDGSKIVCDTKAVEPGTHSTSLLFSDFQLPAPTLTVLNFSFHNQFANLTTSPQIKNLRLLSGQILIKPITEYHSTDISVYQFPQSGFLVTDDMADSPYYYTKTLPQTPIIITAAIPYAIKGLSFTLDVTPPDVGAKSCSIDDVQQVAISRNSQVICQMPSYLNTGVYQVKIPGSSNSVQVQLVNAPKITKFYNPYRLATVHVMEITDVMVSYYLCRYSSGDTSQLVQRSWGRFECKGSGTSIWLIDLHGSILTEPFQLQPVQISHIQDQQIYGNKVRWHLVVDTQTKCMHGPLTLVTKVDRNFIECTVDVNTAKVHLQLDTMTVSNSANITLIPLPQITLPILVTQLKFEYSRSSLDKMNWICNARLQETVHQASDCDFNLLLQQGVYELEIWLTSQDQGIATDLQKTLYLKMKPPQMQIQDSRILFDIIEDLRLSFSCYLPATKQWAARTEYGCELPDRINSTSVKLFANQIPLFTVTAVELVRQFQTLPQYSINQAVQISSIFPSFQFVGYKKDIAVKLAHPAPLEQMNCKIGDKLFRAIRGNSSVTCQDVLLPAQTYYVSLVSKSYSSNEVGFHVLEDVNVTSVHPSIITQTTQSVTIMTSSTVPQALCYIDGVESEAMSQVRSTVFECKVQPTNRLIMSIGIKIGHIYSRQVRVLTQEFTLVTKVIASFGQTMLEVITLQDLTEIKPHCVILLGEIQLRSWLKPTKAFTYCCNQFVDVPEGEYQFQIRIASEIAFQQTITLVADTLLLNYSPKAVFANTTFTLNLNFTKPVKEIKLGETFYQVVDQTVVLPYGLVQDTQLWNGNFVQVMQFRQQSSTINLLQEDFIIVHNSTHRLSGIQLYCRMNNGPAKQCSDGLCNVQNSGVMWISLDAINWLKYADVFIQHPSIIGGLVIESGSYIDVPSSIADYCQVGSEKSLVVKGKCKIIGDGNGLKAYVGILGWTDQEETFNNQKVQIGTFDIFNIRIDTITPKMLIRNFSDLTLHFYGSQIKDMTLVVNEGQYHSVFKAINRQHGYASLPLINSREKAVKVQFRYEGVLGRIVVELPLINMPTVQSDGLHTHKASVKIKGTDLFQELDFWCQFNDQNQFSQSQAQVFTHYITCDLPQDSWQGHLQMYSNALAMHIGNSIKYKRYQPPQVIKSDRHLSSLAANQKFEVVFDQNLLQLVFEKVILIRLGNEIQGECIVVDEQAPDTVKCIITQEIKTSGVFDLYVAAFKDRSWFKETATQITVYDRPELVTIKPKVIFNFSLVENLELTVVNLVPYLITSVVFNGVRKVDPVFKDGKIIIGDIPMNNRKDQKYLVVQLETIFGYLTTPLLVLYSDQLQIGGLLNEGDSLVTQGVQGQSIKILGKKFNPRLPLLCLLKLQSFYVQIRAELLTPEILECNLDSTINQLEAGMVLSLSLQLEDSLDVYPIGEVRVVQKVILNQSTPQKVVQGVPTTIIIQGLWSQVDLIPLIRLNNSVIVSGKYLTAQTQIQFDMPKLSNNGDRVIVQVSQDLGKNWSEVPFEDYTTLSQVSLIPILEPIIFNTTPKTIIRSDTTIITLTGQSLDSLTSCIVTPGVPAVLKLVNSTTSECSFPTEASVSVYQFSVTSILIQQNQIYAGSVEIVDLKQEIIWVPINFTSQISSNLELDLPAGYFVYPQTLKDIEVCAWFGEDLVPVLVLSPFYFDVQSNNFAIQGEYILLSGIGFSYANNITCRIDQETFNVQVFSDIQATCYIRMKESGSIWVQIASMVEEVAIFVTVVKQPVIDYIQMSEISITVFGTNLDSSESCNCIIETTDGVVTTKLGIVVSSFAVECDLPISKFDEYCQSLVVRLEYYQGPIRTVVSSKSLPIPQKTLAIPIIAQMQPIVMLKPDASRFISMRLYDLATCRPVARKFVKCIFTSETNQGSLEWPFAFCQVPQKTELNQDLRIIIDSQTSNTIKNAVTYEFSVQVLRVNSKLVLGLDHDVRILTSFSFDFMCLFRVGMIQIARQPVKLKNQLYICTAEPGVIQLQLIYKNSLVPDLNGSTEFEVTFVNAKMPTSVSPLVMLKPTTLIIDSQEKIYDGCLFKYAMSSQYETDMPCTPPAWTARLWLHVKDTDVYVDTELTVEIRSPSLTHYSILNSNNGSVRAKVFMISEVAGVWICTQVIAGQVFRSTWRNNICDLTFQDGELYLQQGTYKTNVLAIVPKPDEPQFQQQQVQSQEIETILNSLNQQELRIFEGSESVLLYGTFGLDSKFTIDGEILSCKIIRKSEAKCLVNLVPGAYKIKLDFESEVKLIVDAHSFYYPELALIMVGQNSQQITSVIFIGNTTLYFDQLTCNNSHHYGNITYHPDYVTCDLMPGTINNQLVTLSHERRIIASTSVETFDYSKLRFQITPKILICDSPSKSITIQFTDGFNQAKMPNLLNNRYKIDYQSSSIGVVQVPCLASHDSGNFTSVDYQIMRPYFQNVLQIRLFQVIYYAEGKIVYLASRQHQFAMLTRFIDQPINRKNENTFECESVCDLRVMGVSVANSYSPQIILQTPILFTKELRLGFDTPMIEVLNASKSCRLGGQDFTIVLTQRGMMCVVSDLLHDSNLEVTADGHGIGRLLIFSRPRIVQDFVRISSDTSEIKLKVTNVDRDVTCIFKATRTHTFQGAKAGDTVVCALRSLKAGFYTVSLGLGTRQISINEVTIQVVDKISLTPTFVYVVQPVMNITLYGDFRSLLTSQNVTVKVGGQPVNLVTMEQSRLVVTLDLVALDQNVLHEIIVKTSEFQAKTVLEIRSQVDVLDYYPKHIYQQEHQDVFISLVASQPFGTCHTKFLIKDASDQKCLLHHGDDSFSVGYGEIAASKNVEIEWHEISVSFAKILNKKVFVYGRGLKQLTTVGFSCELTSPGHFKQKSITAISHNDTAVECLEEVEIKNLTQVTFTVSDQNHFVNVRSVYVQIPKESVVVQQSVESVNSDFQSYDLGSGEVQSISPTGFLHYQEQLEVKIKTDVTQFTCQYGRREVKPSSDHSCVLNLIGLRESTLIRDGLLLQVIDYATILRFIKWPKIENITQTNEGMIVSGSKFISETRCIVDGQFVGTSFIDSFTLLCQGSQSGIWQLSSNYGFQKSEMFYFYPSTLIVHNITPDIGLQQGNNTKVFVTFDTNITINAMCEFKGINLTQLILISDGIGYCYVPATLYTGTVEFGLVSTAARIQYTNELTFTYIKDIVDLYLSRKVVTPGTELRLIGREFQNSLQYELCCSNRTSTQQRCFRTSFVHQSALTVHFDYPKEYSTFILQVKSSPSLQWRFNSVLVVLKQQPELLSYEVTQLRFGQTQTVFSLRYGYVRSVGINCLQNGQTIEAKIVSKNNEVIQLRCIGLDYAEGFIQIEDLQIPFNITDRIEPTVTKITPQSVLYGIQDYQFALIGQQLFESRIICLFRRGEVQIQVSLMREDYICSLRLDQDASVTSFTEQISLTLFEKDRNIQLYQTQITVTTELRPHLSLVTPNILYFTQQQEQGFIKLTGRNFEQNCKCVFSSRIHNKTATAIISSENELQCRVPSVQQPKINEPSWYQGQLVNQSASVYYVAVQCGQELSESLMVQAQDQFQLTQLSQIIFEEQQWLQVILNGKGLVAGLHCLVTVNGVTTELLALSNIGAAQVTCDLSHRQDLFTQKQESGFIQLKHMHPQNNTLITFSNTQTLKFMQRLTAYPSGTPYLENLDQPLNISLSYNLNAGVSPRCEFRTSDSHFYSTFVLLNEKAGQCYLPNVIGTPRKVDISIRQSIQHGVNLHYTYSNWFTIQFISKPFLTKLDPLFSPFSEDTVITVWGGNLVEGTTIRMNETSVIKLKIISSSQASFTYPKSAPPGHYNIDLFNSLVLTLITRPQIFELLPGKITQMGTHVITLEGIGFTTFSKCVVNGNSYVPTQWLSEKFLQCSVSPQDYANQKIAYSLMSLTVHVIEHQLYISNTKMVLIESSPYIWKVTPTILAEDNRELDVYVSGEIDDSKMKYCKAGSIVEPVRRIKRQNRDCQPVKLIESGSSGHLQPELSCPIIYTIYVCEFALSAGSYKIEIMNSDGTFTQTVFGANSLLVLKTPQLLKVRVPAVPISVASFVEPLGTDFPQGFQYNCIFSKKFCTGQFVTQANWISSATLICPLPDLSITDRQFVSLKIEIFQNPNESYIVHEQINFIVYPLPTIQNLVPNLGSQLGGTTVIIHGSNIDASLGGISCRFGQSIVDAFIVDNSDMLVCTTPPSQNAVLISVEISLNNKQNFYESGTFLYLPQQLSISSVTPVAQDVLGRKTIQIIGSNFPTGNKVYCRFSFPNTSGLVFETLGEIHDSSKILCQSQRQYQIDSSTSLFISFNKQEYLLVSTLKFDQDYRFYLNMPLWNDVTPSIYSQIMLLQADPQLCPVISVEPGNSFQIELPSHVYQDVLIQLNITSSVTSLPLLSLKDFLDDLTEYQLQPNLNQEFSLMNQKIFFRFMFPDNWKILPVYEIYQQIYGLYSWLSLNEHDVIECDDYRQYMITLRIFEDPSKELQDPNHSRMTCHLGTQTLQHQVSRTDMLTVECVTPRFVQPAPAQDLLADDLPIQVLHISPSYAFKDDINIHIYVEAIPVYNITSLTCLIYDVILPGRYFLTNGIEYIKCTIPSFIYLDTIGAGWGAPQAVYKFGIEVSLDGVRYSSNGFQFVILDMNQFQETSHRVGPEEGGTIINISVLDFPEINNEAPTAQCIFPGYDLEPGGGVVQAVYVDEYNIQCTSLPLHSSLTAVAQGSLIDHTTYTIAKVQLFMLGYKHVYDFFFLYMRDVQIFEIIPQNVFFLAGQQSKRVIVRGQHFLPVYNNLICRVEFPDQPQEFVGEFLNNHTVGCDIPPPPASLPLPTILTLSVSFNSGQQYVATKVKFNYAARDTIGHIYPWRQFVMGNELIKATVSYFFDTSYRYASCMFSYTDTTSHTSSYVVKVIAFESDSVTCYIPAAYLISTELATLGGPVQFSISSNQRDYSVPFTFTYLKQVKITQVYPPFVKMNKLIECTIQGLNFVNTVDTGLLSVKLKKIITEPNDSSLQSASFSGVQTITKQTRYDGTNVHFIFPSHIFQDKDWVEVELSFDDITWDKSDKSRLVVYKEIVIEQLRPNVVYTNKVGNDIFFNLGEVWDAGRGGDVFNSTGYGHLLCRFSSETETLFETAYFVNRTLIGCNAPAFTQPAGIQVDLTFDNKSTFTNAPITLWVVAPPVIQVLNNTEYYYTFEEQVFIKITGLNLDSSGEVYVRVGDQVQIQKILRWSGQKFIVFKMPVQLDLGKYTIQISTDGIFFLPADDSVQVTISKCPNGFTCSQEISTICPQGFYCPHNTLQQFQPRECLLGTFMTDTGAEHCLPCTAGTYCAGINNIFKPACPVGYLCDQISSYSPTQLKECPEGYYCPSGTMFLDPLDLLGAHNMRACPDGHFCKKGTMQLISSYGNYTTPQPCKDGVICGQSVFQEVHDDLPGASDPYGISQCQNGFYCKRGILNKCPIGHMCGQLALDHPEVCAAGTYQSNTTQDVCELCPLGTFCYFSAMEKPIKCSPGFTCQLEGSQFPNQLCPAGSFCNLATATNQTNSTVQDYYRPIVCYASTYCLAGMSTPFVDLNNPQSAQRCIAGTFCEAGSDSPEGKGKCLEGYYCPPNTFSMIPTDPGFFAEGTGNVSQEKCRPGTFQNLTQSASCQTCPLGHFCPNQQMIDPFICREGTFSKSLGQTQCTNCPLGTFSDSLGVKYEKDCKRCEPRYLCTNTGLTEMRQAQACQEGYYCWYSTTTTQMLNSKVMTGYYGGQNVTGFPEYLLCLPGKYCPAGTATSKVRQLDCLRNYFCPLGTAGQLTLKGDFDPQTHQVNRWVLITAIQKYIADTELIMTNFRLLNETKPFDELLRKYKASNKTKEYNELQWEIYKYKLNMTNLAERYKYLNDTLYPDNRCEEDALIPEDLIVAYIKNGTNLKCPRGTESDRSSWCMGHCKINIASKFPVSVLDPVNSVKTIDSVSPATTTRLLQDKPKRDYSVTGPGVYDTMHIQTIKPLQQAKIYFDFRELPIKMIYNEHFSIVLQDSRGMDYKLPDYFSLQNNDITQKRDILCIRLFNFSKEDRKFTVGLNLFNAIFVPYLELLSTKVSIELSSANRQLYQSNNTFGMIVNQYQMEGITMPYNCIDWGNDPSLWLDFVSLGNITNPTTKRLDKDAFDNTYWQSKQINAVVMPWIPFFSNCDGSDSHIIPYDIFEFTKNTNNSYCNLPKYADLRVVNPIPSDGLEPVADRCTLNLQCRYDEDLTVVTGQTLRWYQIQELRNLFFLTQDPITVESFFQKEDSTVDQTAYNSLIEDGSDLLLAVAFIPIAGQVGYPRTVKIDFAYYQKTADIKVVQSMNVYLLDYDGLDISGLTRDQIPTNYTLQINYIPLDYFNLVNNFQFSVPIYILLFSLVSLIIIFGILVFWLTILAINKLKRPPNIRFLHLAKVTFFGPAFGSVLSFVPVGIVGGLIIVYQNSTLFANLPADFSEIGNKVSHQDQVRYRRGRIGLQFWICGLLFLNIGAQLIIHKPSASEEREVLAKKLRAKREEMLEMSIDEDGGFFDPETQVKDEFTNVRGALQWKRRHFFVQCLFVSMALLCKLEYSYTKIFANNMTEFLLMFMFLDILAEQVLVRLVMSEALLVAPLLGTFVITEFVMTMGAVDFKYFIGSYFIEVFLQIASRTYVGPFIEKVEALTQIMVIKLSMRFEFIRKLAGNLLVKQLASQLQLMSLNEYKAKSQKRIEDNPEYQTHQFEWQLEKGEGLEALLGSVLTYSSQTQGLMLIPVTLLLIIAFANETKIPQNYEIRQGDLWYYFFFTVVIIIPQYTVDIFLLHILEVVHGYKTYDYLTYCDYRVQIRTKRWVTERALDRSINHAFRSLDALCFGSQYYFIISITTWGMIFLYLGFTAMIRSNYNPFSDPSSVIWCLIIGLLKIPIQMILSKVSIAIGVWKVSANDKIVVDVGTINRLDQANNIKRLVKNVQTNPFRHKFIVINREWVISNLAVILGGRAYAGAGAGEMTYLRHLYQMTVNAEVIESRLKKKQQKLRDNLKLLPYNQLDMNERVDVSEDSVSDVPVIQWDVPEALARPHCYHLMRMWLDFARQNIRLKFMVADIVKSQIRRKCQKCSSKFRLQVIQKIEFNSLTAKFRRENLGLQFTKGRWRQFYKRRQIFVTLCMECAYIQTLKAGALREKDSDLRKLMAQNALKHVGASDAMIAKKLKKKSVQSIIFRWLWMSRGLTLHKEDPILLAKRDRKERIKNMELEQFFEESTPTEDLGATKSFF